MTMTLLDRYNRAKQLGYPAEASVIGQRRQGYVVGREFWFELNGVSTYVELDSVDKTLVYTRY